MFRIKYKSNEYWVDQGETVDDFILKRQIQSRKYHIVGALIDNKYKNLNYVFDRDCAIELVDTSSTIGQQIYNSSLFFVFIKAIYNINPKINVKLHTANEKWQYCELEMNDKISVVPIGLIKKEMEKLIRYNLPYKEEKLIAKEIFKLYKTNLNSNNAELFNTLKIENIAVYNMDDFVAFFNVGLVPSTGYIQSFDICSAGRGIVISSFNDFKINEIDERSLGNFYCDIPNSLEKSYNNANMNYISNINKLILRGEEDRLTQMSEGIHSRKINDLAKKITKENIRLVLIAGPSSSGKTTFANRLSKQIEKMGFQPLCISLDDFFLNREDTPLDKYGQKDYESLEAVDLNLFNKDILKLLNGEYVKLPRYDFVTGKRVYTGNDVLLADKQPIIIEGIHGLNPKLTNEIQNAKKIKVYIEPISQFKIDDYNVLYSADVRLIRRIVRDKNFRGNSVSDTLRMWKSVKRGEEKNINPFKKEADVIFDSSLIYEMSLMKKYIEPLLEAIGVDDIYYVDAVRLIRILSYFVSMRDYKNVNPDSILREFIQFD